MVNFGTIYIINSLSRSALNWWRFYLFFVHWWNSHVFDRRIVEPLEVEGSSATNYIFLILKTKTNSKSTILLFNQIASKAQEIAKICWTGQYCKKIFTKINDTNLFSILFYYFFSFHSFFFVRFASIFFGMDGRTTVQIHGHIICVYVTNSILHAHRCEYQDLNIYNWIVFLPLLIFFSLSRSFPLHLLQIPVTSDFFS